MRKTLYLVDGHALAYRAYFALITTGSGFRSRSGEPTAATFGFMNILLSIMEKEKPEYLAVAFDTGKTFRNETYPQYKATREKMPEDLVPQIDRIREIIDAFHFPRLEMEGYEADDVIGSVAVQTASMGTSVKIITGDRDLLQLVTDRIAVNLAGGKSSQSKDYFPEDVVEKMGVRPDQIVDMKALMGDSSDNIPGIKGIGPKTAASLLKKYDTLDGVYANIDAISGRTGTLLEESKEDAYLSYTLAKIITNLKIDFSIERAGTDQIDLQAITDIFKELQFRTLTKKVASLLGAGVIGDDKQLSLFEKEPIRLGLPSKHDIEVTIINDTDKLKNLVQKLDSCKRISFDTETTSTDPMCAHLVGISIALQPGSGYYIPLGHVTGEKQLDLGAVRDAIGLYFSNDGIEKIGHNLKYDCLVLRNHGFEINHLAFDTMIAGWVLEPASRRLGLKKMAGTELNIEMTNIQELIGSGRNQITFDKVMVTDAAQYASADAEVPLRLMKVLRERLEKNSLTKIFYDIEMPLIPVLIDMEFTGISVDTVYFKEFSQSLKKRMEAIESSVQKTVGYDFNMNSTQQLSKALFETLGLTPPDSSNKTKSGHYSTAAVVLEAMRDQHPVMEELLEYREISKLVSTYLDALPQQVNPKTGRVHTTFNQTGSVTGRLASADPNLQNIPTRTELGHKVRDGFVAGEGNYLLSVDYSQIELRIVAHMAEDEAMLKSFREGQDIHTATAAAIYEVPISSVTKEQRRHAKAINFGLIYGMSAFGLTRTTNLTLAESENFVQAYFQKFPGVKRFLDDIRKEAADKGYVETMLGRRRYFPQLRNPANAQIRARAEREAINAPVQGTAADILKVAMIRLPEALQKSGYHAKMLVQVHDELLLECPKAEINNAIETVCNVMENAYTLSVPLVTDVAYGENWGALKEKS